MFRCGSGSASTVGAPESCRVRGPHAAVGCPWSPASRRDDVRVVHRVASEAGPNLTRNDPLDDPADDAALIGREGWLGDHVERHHVMLSAAFFPSIVNTMIRITGISDHDLPERAIMPSRQLPT
jgi:hypothetical protein